MQKLIRFYAFQHEGVIPSRVTSPFLLQVELKNMMMKRPLNSKWTLWFYKNESRNWEENQRQVVPQIMLRTKTDFLFSNNHKDTTKHKLLINGMSFKCFKC